MFVLKIFAKLISKAAYSGAGLPSAKGMFEMNVPKKLQE